MEEALNLILVGAAGTGQALLATSLRVSSIHAGKRVRL